VKALAAFLAGALGGFIGGVAVEYVRPFGTEWQRRAGVDLAKRLARMPRPCEECR
jgi:hypothetical protein